MRKPGPRRCLESLTTYEKGKVASDGFQEAVRVSSPRVDILGGGLTALGMGPRYIAGSLRRCRSTSRWMPEWGIPATAS